MVFLYFYCIQLQAKEMHLFAYEFLMAPPEENIVYRTVV